MIQQNVQDQYNELAVKNIRAAEEFAETLELSTEGRQEIRANFRRSQVAGYSEADCATCAH